MQRIYFIPTNYRESGYIFNGMIAKRNAVDALALGLLGFFLVRMLPIKADMLLSAYILFIGLLGMVGIVGINGVPVSTWLFDTILWRRRRKPYLYNTHGGAYSVSAADVMLNEPDLRDALYDTLDKMRAAMKGAEPNYIEGETFQFAEDPELEALKSAHEELLEEKAEKEKEQGQEPGQESEEAEAPVTKKPQHSATIKTGNIDISDILDNLVLEDFDDDEREEEV
jgi:hypothetical protein